MPCETGSPWIVKDIGRFLRLLGFAEAFSDQLEHCGQGSIGILAFGVDDDTCALAGGEHHHAHDALRVDPLSVAFEPYVGGKLAGGLRQFRRGSRMQAQLVDDWRFSSWHPGRSSSGA